MTLGKRERILAIAVGVLVVGAVVYAYPLSSYLDERAKVIADTQTVNKDLKLAHARDTVGQRAVAEWKQLLAKGLKSSLADTESQALHFLGDWAKAAGVMLPSVRADLVGQVGGGDFQQVRIIATGGTGTSNAIDKLIWTLETSEVPLQVSELHLNSRKDGMDDLSMTLTVNAIAYAPQAVKTNRGTRAKGDTK
jgi:hypothetical protein